MTTSQSEYNYGVSRCRMESSKSTQLSCQCVLQSLRHCPVPGSDRIVKIPIISSEEPRHSCIRWLQNTHCELMTMTRMVTYDADEIKEFNKCWVEEVVLVCIGNERFHDWPEQIKSCNMSIIELVLQPNTLPQQSQSSWPHTHRVHDDTCNCSTEEIKS